MLKRIILTVAAVMLITGGALAQSAVDADPLRVANIGDQQRTELAIPPPTAVTPQATQPTPPQPRQPEPAGQPVNIKLEVTITDHAPPGEAVRKTVSMLVADRTAGSIRTGGIQVQTAQGPQAMSINVDATPTLRDGVIRVQFGLEYQPRPSGDWSQSGAAPANHATLTRVPQVNERLTVILQDGKPLVISQAADAASDRKVTVELKATILK